MTDVWSGIVVGGAGGAIAGLTVAFVRYAHLKVLDGLHKRRVYNWLKGNTKDQDGEKYRSTRAIASGNNLTEDRARYVCSIHKKIYLSTGKEEDMWSLYEHGDRSVYEKTRHALALGSHLDQPFETVAAANFRFQTTISGVLTAE